MAARRAAAKAAAAKAETPPPPAPEPTPEPQPEPKELENLADQKKSTVPEAENKRDDLSKETPENRVTEKIIERIIICPGGQAPYMQTAPMAARQGHCYCMQPCIAKGKNAKKRRKTSKPIGIGQDGLCGHPFCVAQREQSNPQRLPWTSGMNSYQNRPVSGNPNVMICQTPVLSCCPKCNPPDSDSSESEEEDPVKDDTAAYMTFMNMVFAAANVINEKPGMG